MRLGNRSIYGKLLFFEVFVKVLKKFKNFNSALFFQKMGLVCPFTRENAKKNVEYAIWHIEFKSFFVKYAFWHIYKLV